jgi:hypothetical protein
LRDLISIETLLRGQIILLGDPLYRGATCRTGDDFCFYVQRLTNDQRALAHGQNLLGFATMVPIQTGVSAQTGLGELLASFFS